MKCLRAGKYRICGSIHAEVARGASTTTKVVFRLHHARPATIAAPGHHVAIAICVRAGDWIQKMDIDYIGMDFQEDVEIRMSASFTGSGGTATVSIAEFVFGIDPR